MADGSIIIDTQIDNDGAIKDLKQLKGTVETAGKSFEKAGNRLSQAFGAKQLKSSLGSVSGALTKFGAAIGIAFGVTQIVKFGKESSKTAMEVEANMLRVVDIFGKASQSIFDFSENNASSLGMSQAAAYKYASTYGNLFSVFMDDEEEMSKVTQQYLNATAVVASKTGRTVEDVAERIRSGLLGNTEAIEDLGINVNIKTIEITEAFQRIADGRSWEQLNAYEQSQVRQLAILEQATKKYGDTVAVNANFALQKASAATENLKTTIGNLLNIAIVPAIELFTKFINVINQVLKGLFGTKATNQNAITEAQNNMAVSSNNAAKGQKNLAEQTKKSSKETKKALAGFDEINRLEKKESDSSSQPDTSNNVASTISGGTAKFKIETETDTSGIDNFKSYVISVFDSIKKWVNKNFSPIFKDIFTKAQPIITDFKNNLSMVFSDIATLGQPLIDWFNNSFTPFLQTYITYIGDVVLGIFDTFNMIFNDIWNIVIYPVFKKFITVILPILTQFSTEWTKICDTIFSVGKEIFDMLWKEGIAPYLEKITKIWSDMWDGIKAFWDKWGKPIFDNIRLAFENMGEIFKSGWNNFLKPIWENFMKIIDKLWEKHLKPLWNNFLDFVGELVNGALEIYNKFIAPIVKWLVEILGPIFAKIFNTIADVVGNVIGGVIDIVNGFITTIKGIVQFVTGIFTGDWEKAWNGVKNIFKGIWDMLVGIVKTPINLIIDLINGMIKAIVNGVNFVIKNVNKIGFDLPDWLGGGKFGFDLKLFTAPQIPKLAQGAVIPPNREFLAVLGDQKSGVNIEAPLETIVEAFRQVQGNENGNTTFIFEVDKREFAKVVYKLNKQETQRIGLSFAKGGAY